MHELTRSAKTLARLGALTALLVGCDPEGLGESNPNFLVVAHHGAPNLAPENTIPSFEAAVATGANAIETDFCITSDGVLVAFHDCDPDDPIALARQAGGEGYTFIPYVPPVGSPWRRPTKALTLAELRAHYGYRLLDGARDDEAYIPTLGETLAWFGSEPRVRAVYFDLKFVVGEESAAVAFLDQVWAAVEESPELEATTFYFLNVHPEVIRALSAERLLLGADALRVVLDFEQPGALAGTLSEGLRDVSVGLTPSFTWSGYKRELAGIVREREAGRVDSVLAWTFDEEMKLAELLYYSVDGVITNNPATLHRMWKETLD